MSEGIPEEFDEGNKNIMKFMKRGITGREGAGKDSGPFNKGASLITPDIGAFSNKKHGYQELGNNDLRDAKPIKPSELKGEELNAFNTFELGLIENDNILNGTLDPLKVVISENSKLVAVRKSNTCWHVFRLFQGTKDAEMWIFMYNAKLGVWKCDQRKVDNSPIPNKGDLGPTQVKGQEVKTYFYFSSDSKLAMFVVDRTQLEEKSKKKQKQAPKEEGLLRANSERSPVKPRSQAPKTENVNKEPIDTEEEEEEPTKKNLDLILTVFEFKEDSKPQSILKYTCPRIPNEMEFLPQLTTFVYIGLSNDIILPKKESGAPPNYCLLMATAFPEASVGESEESLDASIEVVQDSVYHTPYESVCLINYGLFEGTMDDSSSCEQIYLPAVSKMQWAGFSSPFQFITVSYHNEKFQFKLHSLLYYHTDENKNINLQIASSDYFNRDHNEEPLWILPVHEGFAFQDSANLSTVTLVGLTDTEDSTRAEEIHLKTPFGFNGDIKGRLLVNLTAEKKGKHLRKGSSRESTMVSNVKNNMYLDFFGKNQNDYVKLCNFKLVERGIQYAKITPDLKYIILVSSNMNNLSVHFSFIEANQAYPFERTIIPNYTEDEDSYSAFTKLIYTKTSVSKGASIKQDYIYSSGYIQKVSYFDDKTVDIHRVKCSYNDLSQINNIIFCEEIDINSPGLEKISHEDMQMFQDDSSEENQEKTDIYLLYKTMLIMANQFPCLVAYSCQDENDYSYLNACILNMNTLELNEVTDTQDVGTEINLNEFLENIWGYTGHISEEALIHPATTRETLIFQNDDDLIIFRNKSALDQGNPEASSPLTKPSKAQPRPNIKYEIDNFFKHQTTPLAGSHPLILTPDQNFMIAKVSFTPPKTSSSTISPKVVTVLKLIDLVKKTEDIICELTTTSKINYSFAFSSDSKYLLMTGYSSKDSHENKDEAGYIRVIDWKELRIVFEFQSAKLNTIIVTHWLSNALVQIGNTTGEEGVELFYTDFQDIRKKYTNTDAQLMNILNYYSKKAAENTQTSTDLKREVLPNWINFMTPNYSFGYKDIFHSLLEVPDKKLIKMMLHRVKLKEIITDELTMKFILNNSDKLPMLFDVILAELSSFYYRKAEYPIINERAFEAFVNGEDNKKMNFVVNKSLTNFLTFILMAPCRRFETCQLKDEEFSTIPINDTIKQKLKTRKSTLSYQGGIKKNIDDTVEDKLDSVVESLTQQFPTYYKYYQVYYSLVKLNLKNGSRFSMNLFLNLSSLPETDLRSSLKALVYFKWSKIFKYVATYSIIYWLTCICIYIYYYNPNIVWLGIVSLILIAFHILFELMCLIAHPKRHFFKKSNIFDTITLGGNTALTLYLLASSKHYTVVLAWLKCLCLMTIWIRGITWLRLFRNTRYLITMIFKVLVDILPFLVILILTAILYGFVWKQTAYLSERDGEEPDNFFKVFIEITNITFGNSPEFDDLPSLIRFIILIIGNLVLALVLNNLLIAIINETYISINTDRDVHDVKEILEVITDFDSILYWKNKNLHKQSEKYNDTSSLTQSQTPDTPAKNFKFIYCSLQEKDIDKKTLEEIVQPFTENLTKLSESLRAIKSDNSNLDTATINSNRETLSNIKKTIKGKFDIATKDLEISEGNSFNVQHRLDEIKKKMEEVIDEKNFN